jgi:hypothetical protein
MESEGGTPDRTPMFRTQRFVLLFCTPPSTVHFVTRSAAVRWLGFHPCLCQTKEPSPQTWRQSVIHALTVKPPNQRTTRATHVLLKHSAFRIQTRNVVQLVKSRLQDNGMAPRMAAMSVVVTESPLHCQKKRSIMHEQSPFSARYLNTCASRNCLLLMYAVESPLVESTEIPSAKSAGKACRTK